MNDETRNLDGGWWVVLLYLFTEDVKPALPRYRVVTRFECDSCGKSYSVSPWSGYPPDYCDACGGRIVENRYTVEV